MSWLLILAIWSLAGGLGYFMAKATKEGKGIGSDELFPGSKDSPDTKNHWTEYVTDEENEEEEESHHWTEYVYDDDTRDRDDEWEEEREDDWGDPY